MTAIKQPKPKMFTCEECGERKEEWYPGCTTCLGCHELYVMRQTGVGVVHFQPGIGMYMKL